MTKEEIIAKINFFLAKEFEIDENLIFPDAILRDTLSLDSLDYVDLVVIIESNFNIKVQQGDFQNIITFMNLYDYILTSMNY
ncbi:MAG: phosphopantetheine-binding protein [Prevotellaceae bacterium]|jgi:acyl carrier protein|nr:phosphopantetheine-binding protein [Prevotellaceae bacterium]